MTGLVRQSIELGQIVDVLLPMLVSGPEPALLLRGQAMDQAAAVQVRLPAMTVGVKWTGCTSTQRPPEVLRVDGQIKIPVLPGLPSGQRGNAPATAHPMTDPGTIQHVQDHDHVFGAHAPG
jgi:hypothetical protein